MATRNPTDFVTTALDLLALRTREQIITTVPSSIVDDQAYVLDKPELIVSDCWLPIGVAFEWSGTLRVFHLDSKDMCDEAGVTNDEIQHTFYVYAWAADGSSDGQVTLASTLAVASTSGTVSITTSDTTPAWHSATLNVKTNRQEDTLTLSASGDSGSGIYVAGLVLVADET